MLSQELLNRTRHKSPFDFARPTGFTKCRKQRARKWILCKLPFRMPLHAQGEIRCVGDPERLDDSVRCARLDSQILTQRFDSLPMQGIDLQAVLSGDFSQSSSRLQEDFVSRPVLHVQRRGFVFAAIGVSLYLVQPLRRYAAEGATQFLKSPATRK